MERLEWNKLLDEYLITGHMLSEEYEQLNDIQRAVIQELKRAFARINKQDVCEIHHSLQDNK